MRKTFLSLAASAALLLAPALAGAASYTFSGQIDGGPPGGLLAGEAFAGSFEFDSSSVTPDFSSDLPLSAFSMLFFGQTYTLASADPGTVPVAAFYEGSFVGLSYVDADASDRLVRPAVSLIPGFVDLAGAYLSYDQSTDPGAGLAGLGSFSVAVVPEPATVLLMLAGLGAVGGMARRARRSADQAER